MRHPLPFSPGYEFMATRVLALNGRAYQAGDTIDKTGLSVSRLRQLYEGRKIAPLIPEPVVEPAVEPALEPAEEASAVGDLEDAPAVVTKPKSKRKG